MVCLSDVLDIWIPALMIVHVFIRGILIHAIVDLVLEYMRLVVYNLSVDCDKRYSLFSSIFRFLVLLYSLSTPEL